MDIDYTSRDYAALKADLIALINERTSGSWNPVDYSDLGNVLVESFAYMGDVVSHYIDRVANETSIDTAIQTDTLLSLANLFDYKPSGPTPATVNILFKNVSSASIDIPVGTQVMAPLSYGPYSEVYFETTGSASAVAAGASITLLAQEGKTVNTDRPDLIDPTYNKPLPASLGTSDGTTSQEIVLLDVNVVDSSIAVYIGQGVAFTTWKYVDNLLEYGPSDTVFTTKRNSDNTTTIIFGDAVNGAVPPSGQLISSLYKTSVGLSGNIKAATVTELTFVPGNLDPQITSYFTVSNALPASGGADPDDISQIKKKIKATIMTQRRAITLKDFANLALEVPLVGKANATSSIYSSVLLYIQPADDNSPAPGYPQAEIINAVGSGTAVTFTTRGHTFIAGDTVTISGVLPVAYNLTGTVQAGVTSTTFSFASALTSTFISGGLAIDATPTAAWTTLQSAVAAFMADKIVVGTTLTIQPPSYVPMYITVTATIGDSYKQADIKLAIYQTLLGVDGYFNYKNNVFGDAIPVSAIRAAIQNIPGVITSEVTQLCTDNSATVGSITLSASQLPYLMASNLTTTITGGI